VTLWCEVSAVGIVGPYFFENEYRHAVTFVAERYSDILETFLTARLWMLQGHERKCFQQDGATAHPARLSMAVLRGFFRND
jgi:hypothetical protein